MRWIEDESNTVDQWIERSTIGGIRGYTDQLWKYPNLIFRISPLTIETSSLSTWRMEFRQKTRNSRMYVHFHNKMNFGFRFRLPPVYYSDIDSIFDGLGKRIVEYTFEPQRVYSSEISVTNISPKTKIVEKIVTENISFEETMKKERDRIFKKIGDYRSYEEVKEFDYSNVINIEDYLHQVNEIKSTEEVFDNLLEQIG